MSDPEHKAPEAAQEAPTFFPPAQGEVITSELTRNTYTMGDKIGEGSFGEVYACTDGWNNDLAAKVLKPLRPYDQVKESATSEMQKLFLLRHPNITYFYDAFEYRQTFYIVTERCHCSLSNLFTMESGFIGRVWIMPIARCILQAVHFTHLNTLVHQDIHPGNVFTSFIKDEMLRDDPDRQAIQFKLGDLGVAKLFGELDAKNTRAQWMLPPEALDGAEFGPLDHGIDIYHCGLLFLQIALSQEIQFTQEEIKLGKPREMATQLPPPFNFALEKALRRHVQHRTDSAQELWRDLNSSIATAEEIPTNAQELSDNTQFAPPTDLPAGPTNSSTD
jgi:eukaryotic-like serine/threonine-protein kinase